MLVLAAAVLAVVTSGTASAASGYGYNNYIKSKISMSGGNVVGSWEQGGNYENCNVRMDMTGTTLTCTNYFQNSASAGSAQCWWSRDVYGASGVLDPNFNYVQGPTVPQGQTS